MLAYIFASHNKTLHITFANRCLYLGGRDTFGIRGLETVVNVLFTNTRAS